MIAAEDYVRQPFPGEGDLYKSLIENSPLPMWIYDLDTLHFLAVNGAAVHRYGYSQAEFLTMTINDLRPPEESEGAGKPVDAGRLLKEWRGWRHRLRNGEIIEVELTTQGLRYEGYRAAFVIINNIKGRDRLRIASPETDDRFRLIFEDSSAAMILYDPENRQIIDANPAAATLYGSSRERLCTLNIDDVVISPRTEELPVPAADLFPTEPGNRTRARQRLADGGTREAEVQATEINAGEKKLVHLIISEVPAEPEKAEAPIEAGVEPEAEVLPETAAEAEAVPQTDVSAEPAKVEEPGKIDERIPELLEFIPVGYYKRTAGGSLLDVNPAFAEMLGYTKEELLSGNTAPSTFAGYPNTNPVTALDSEVVVYRLLGKDGGEIWIEDHSRYVRDVNGVIVGREGFCRDITTQKKAQAEINKYEILFKDLSESVIFVRKSDGRIIETNKAAELAHGFSRDELLAKTIFELRAMDSPESVRRQIQAVNGEAVVFETIHRRKDGSIFPVETVLQHLADGGENILVSISRDCTVRKRTEAAVRQSEEKYRSIFEKSPLGILYFDVNGVVTDCNDSLAAIMASSRKSVIGLKLLELPSKELVAAVKKVLEGKLGVYEGDYRSFTASKSIHVRTTFTLISSATGRPAGGMGIFEDITERDKAENALRESEKRYRLLYENSPVPYHLLDDQWKILDVNASWVELLGLAKNEAFGRDFVEFVAPEHVALMREKLEAFKSSGALGNLEIDILGKDGRRVSVAVEGKIGRDADGVLRQAQFMLYDVTERKMAEGALKESEQKFRTLAESASTAIFMYQKNKICYVNEACITVTGYSAEELLKMDFWNVVHPDFRQLAKDLGMARQRGEPVPNHFELRIRTKAGESRWIDFTAATTQYKGEVAVRGTVYDITERKKAQEKLEESEEQRRLLVEKSPDAIMIFTDGKLVHLNPATVKLLHGESAGQFIGKSLPEIVHPDSQPGVEAGLGELQKTLNTVEMRDKKLMRVDGSGFDADVVASPMIHLGRPSIQVVARDVRSSGSAQEQFRLQSAALDAASNAIVVTHKDGSIVWANPAFEKLSGYSVQETIGRNIFEIGKSDKHEEKFFQQIRESVLSGNVWHDNVVKRRKNGTLYTEDIAITPVMNPDGAVTHFICVMQDVTIHKSFEEQLLHVKRLEGIGQLVAAIVHDYNNILGVILGYGELIKKKLSENDPVRLPMEAILSAGRRGVDLTRHLLDFEHEGVVSPKIVDVNKAIQTMEGMLLRATGDNLKLEFVPLKGLWNVRIDPIYLYEMMINLATNAREAMRGETGTLEIKTSNVVVDEYFVRKHEGFTPGEYVMISLSDTGKGIDEALQGRIFEPFVTTKKEEHAGLGLAAVYGMAKRNGGGITVRSTPGEGTTFCIYLPRVDNAADDRFEKVIPLESLRENAAVLLVEDQPDLLELVKQNLEDYGYRVMAAVGPQEAIDLCQEYPESIDLLITDVILPGLNGKELSDKIIGMRPQIKTLYMSGYSASSLMPEGILQDGVEFLQKPFTANELAKKVHKVLHS